MDRQSAIAIGMVVVDKQYARVCSIYGLGYRISREELQDMKQECIIAMIGAVDRYQQGPATVDTFLTHRVRGFFIDYLRKHSKTYGKEEELIESVYYDGKHEIPMTLSISVFKHDLLRMINTLPETHKYVVHNHFFLDKSVEEIAVEMGYKKDSGWVYRILRESLKRLKTIIDSEVR